MIDTLARPTATRRNLLRRAAVGHARTTRIRIVFTLGEPTCFSIGIKGFHVGPFRSEIQHHPTLSTSTCLSDIHIFMQLTLQEQNLYDTGGLTSGKIWPRVSSARLGRRKYKKKVGRNEKSYNQYSSMSIEGDICAICGLNDTLRRYEGMKGFDLEDTYVKPFHQPRREIVDRLICSEQLLFRQ